MINSMQYEIVGSILTDDATHYYLDDLEVIDFQDIFCQKAIKGLKELKATNKDITIYNLRDISGLKINDILNVVGSITTTARIESNIKSLKEHTTRRLLIEQADIIKELASDKTKDITEIKNSILKSIQDIKETKTDEVKTLKESMLETYNVLDKRYANKDDNSLYIGLTKLDSILAGLHKEELTTIASRPGVGKSIIGMQMALNLARNKNKVLYVTMEMSTTQLCERIISANTQIDGNRLRLGQIESAEDWGKIQKVAGSFNYNNLLLDKTSRNIQHIKSKIIKYKPDAVIIDYLQLIHSVTKEFSREREVAIITRDLKMMTLDFEIPIVMLAQLNRNADGNRPTLADLRESGAIEQDSDNVIFLHEPKDSEINDLINKGIYTKEFFETILKEQQKLSYIIVEKQRNGATGTIPVIKKPKYMRFSEV